MKNGSLILILLLICSAVEARSPAIPDLCALYSQVYSKSIEKRILSGVPFEIMTTLFKSSSSSSIPPVNANYDQLVYKKSVHITYNLWDELIIIRSGEQVVGKIGIESGSKELCKYLAVKDFNQFEPGKKYRIRLLLNPMWSERMARLQISTTADLEGKRLVDVNWKKLADEMPSEKVLFEEDLDL